MGFERKKKMPLFSANKIFLQASTIWGGCQNNPNWSEMKNWKVLMILAEKNPIQYAQGDKPPPPPCQIGLILKLHWLN